MLIENFFHVTWWMKTWQNKKKMFFLELNVHANLLCLYFLSIFCSPVNENVSDGSSLRAAIIRRAFFISHLAHSVFSDQKMLFLEQYVHVHRKSLFCCFSFFFIFILLPREWKRGRATKKLFFLELYVVYANFILSLLFIFILLLGEWKHFSPR